MPGIVGAERECSVHLVMDCGLLGVLPCLEPVWNWEADWRDKGFLYVRKAQVDIVDVAHGFIPDVNSRRLAPHRRADATGGNRPMTWGRAVFPWQRWERPIHVAQRILGGSRPWTLSVTTGLWSPFLPAALVDVSEEHGATP